MSNNALTTTSNNNSNKGSTLLLVAAVVIGGLAGNLIEKNNTISAMRSGELEVNTGFICDWTGYGCSQ